MNYKNEQGSRYIELTRSEKKSEARKRTIKSFAFSAAAVSAFCISVLAGMANAPDISENAAADLSGYEYSAEEDGNISEDFDKTAAETEEKADREDPMTARTRNVPDIPYAALPAVAPAPEKPAETRAVSVNKDEALESAPASFDVSVKADGETILVTANGTVEDALEKTALELGKRDIVTPSLDTPLTDDTVITVQRVAYYKVVTELSVPYETEYIDDDTLYEGETEIVSYGEEGTITKEYRVKKVDGKRVSSKLISEEVTEEPINEVIARGTKEYEPEDEDIPEDTGYYEEDNDEYYESDTAEYEDVTADIPSEYIGSGDRVHASKVSSVSEFEVPSDLYLDENNVPVNYIRTLHGKSCAYTAEEGALMSTGKTVDQGYVAVNPQIIPYGSKLYIVADDGEVYGYAIAADTGGSVARNDIVVDLFMWSYDECMQWGAKNVTIYVLDEDDD